MLLLIKLLKNRQGSTRCSCSFLFDFEELTQENVRFGLSLSRPLVGVRPELDFDQIIFHFSLRPEGHPIAYRLQPRFSSDAAKF